MSSHVIWALAEAHFGRRKCTRYVSVHYVQLEESMVQSASHAQPVHKMRLKDTELLSTISTLLSGYHHILYIAS